MKKLLALLVLLCVVMSSTSVSANHQHREYIDYGEVKVITIPEPDEHFKNNVVYYNHYLIFKPTVSDTYRIIINYEEDEANPYPIYMGMTSYIKVNGNDRYIDDMEYRIVENGLEFYGEVDRYYELMFQYMSYDKRNPQFTFYLETDLEIPKTGDAGLLLPGALVLLSTLMTACLILNRKKFQ